MFVSCLWVLQFSARAVLALCRLFSPLCIVLPNLGCYIIYTVLCMHWKCRSVAGGKDCQTGSALSKWGDAMKSSSGTLMLVKGCGVE